MSSTSQSTTHVPSVGADTLAAAEQFLADTAEVIHPGMPATALLTYTARYRAHLSALVTATRRADPHGPMDV